MAAEAVNIEELHAKSEIRKVSLDTLRVDRSYQRDPTQSLVDKIADEYDEVSAEMLLVSDRGERPDPQESGLWIVNGQHRSLGARKRGETEVWARVLDLSSFDDPAQIEATFRLRTNVRMSDKPLERFKAQLRAGDPQSAAIAALLAKYGTEINETVNVETGINAVAGVERLYEVDQGVLLNRVLETIRDAFNYVGGKYASASMLAGIAWFIVKHDDEADRTRFIEKLNETGTKGLDRRARTIQAGMGGSGWLNYYRAFVEVYNERLHAKQQLEWRHGGSSGFTGAVKKWGGSHN